MKQLNEKNIDNIKLRKDLDKINDAYKDLYQSYT